MDIVSIIIPLVIPIIFFIGYIIHLSVIHRKQEQISSLVRYELLKTADKAANEYLDNLIDKYSAMGYNGYIVNRYQKLDKEPKKKTYPTNCKNCGAPLHSHRCEFCDTEYN